MPKESKLIKLFIRLSKIFEEAGKKAEKDEVKLENDNGKPYKIKNQKRFL